MKQLLTLGQYVSESSHKRVSFSQYSLFSQCPRRWKLTYIDKLDPKEPSIHTVFGTAFHETMQHWLSVMYNDTIKASDQIGFEAYLLDMMRKEYAKEKAKFGEDFSTSAQLAEFHADGVTILNWLRKKRKRYFSPQSQELVGIELKLYQPASENPNVFMVGYIDLIIYDKSLDKVYIIDIKTSTRGWNKYQKADQMKKDQLVLYKEYFSRQTGWPMDKIEVEFLVVKRKIYEDSAYPIPRAQQIRVASGKMKRKQAVQRMETFVEFAFNDDGSYAEDKEYPAITGKNKSHCKFCPFAEREDLCPKSSRA